MCLYIFQCVCICTNSAFWFILLFTSHARKQTQEWTWSKSFTHCRFKVSSNDYTLQTYLQLAYTQGFWQLFCKYTLLPTKLHCKLPGTCTGSHLSSFCHSYSPYLTKPESEPTSLCSTRQILAATTWMILLGVCRYSWVCEDWYGFVRTIDLKNKRGEGGKTVPWTARPWPLFSTSHTLLSSCFSQTDLQIKQDITKPLTTTSCCPPRGVFRTLSTCNQRNKISAN